MNESSLAFGEAPEERPLDEVEVQELLRLRGEDEFGVVDIPVTTPKTSRARRWPLAVAVLASAGILAIGYNRPPSALSAEASETVPIGTVSYGPDVFKGAVVDPSFHPQGPVPKGLGISATAGRTLYGCGDRHALGAKPPEGADEKIVEARVQELMEFARDRKNADSPIPVRSPVDPKYSTGLPSKTITMSLEWSNGTSNLGIEVPIGRDEKSIGELRRIAHNVAKYLCDSVADGIDFINHRD